MQITRFEVQGYKNLTAPIVLEGLERINVIHGNNDVGKSNLLEAVELAFSLLGIKGPLPLEEPRLLSHQEFQAATRLNSREIFDARSPGPIEISFEATLSEEELERTGISSLHAVGFVKIVQTLESDQRGEMNWRIFAEPGDYRLMRPIFYFLARNHFVGSQVERPRFQVIPAQRLTLEPTELALRLYDAKESAEPSERDRWELYQEIVSRLIGLDKGQSIFVVYERATGKARLTVESRNGTKMILPLNLMGSGTQQIAALIGHALLSGATLLAIEEPEMNLRYERQLALREAFDEIVSDPRGPSQLFLTSHSPAFEVGRTFYAMESGPEGPTVNRRPAEQAATFLALSGVPAASVGVRATQSYVSSDGILKLPPRVLDALELQAGGGVVFDVSDGGRTEIMTNEEFVRRSAPSSD